MDVKTGTKVGELRCGVGVMRSVLTPSPKKSQITTTKKEPSARRRP